jgi:hypothetical protein
LYRSSERFQLEQAKVERLAGIYINQLPADVTDLIENFNVFPRNGTNSLGRRGSSHDRSSEYESARATLELRRVRQELQEAEADRRKSDKENAQLKEKLAKTVSGRTFGPSQTVAAPPPFRPNGNHFSTSHNEVSMHSGADDLQHRTSEHEGGEHQATQRERDEAFDAWVQAAGSQQPKLLMDTPYSFTATTRSDSDPEFDSDSSSDSKFVASRDRVIVIEEHEPPRRRYRNSASGSNSPKTIVVDSHNKVSSNDSGAGKEKNPQQTLDGWLSKTKPSASNPNAGNTEQQEETNRRTAQVAQQQTDDPPDEEPVNDDLGWGSWAGTSKKSKKKENKDASSAETWSSTLGCVLSTGSPPVTLDNPEGESSPKEEKKEELGSETPEHAAMVDGMVGPIFGIGKKKKKKKTVVNLVVEEAAEDDEWGFESSTKKNKKKKKGDEFSFDEIIEHPDGASASDDGWGSFRTKKDKKKMKTAPLEQIIEHTDDARPARPDAWDWGASSGTKDKKGKKKMEILGSIDEVLFSTPEPAVEASGSGEGEWS